MNFDQVDSCTLKSFHDGHAMHGFWGFGFCFEVTKISQGAYHGTWDFLSDNCHSYCRAWSCEKADRFRPEPMHKLLTYSSMVHPPVHGLWLPTHLFPSWVWWSPARVTLVEWQVILQKGGLGWVGTIGWESKSKWLLEITKNSLLASGSHGTQGPAWHAFQWKPVWGNLSMKTSAQGKWSLRRWSHRCADLVCTQWCLQVHHSSQMHMWKSLFASTPSPQLMIADDLWL